MTLPGIEAMLSLGRAVEAAGLGPLWLVLLVAVRATLLLAIAWATTRLVRGSAARHLVWAATLAALLLLPLGGLLPAVELAVLPAEPPAGVSIAAGTAELAGPPAVDAASESADGASAPRPSRAAVGSSPGVRSERAQATAWSLTDPVVLVSVLWSLGVAAMLGRLIACLVARRRLLAGAERLGSAAEQQLDRLAERLGIGRSVRLLASAEVGVPMTWGTRRPLVLLPIGARGWSADLLDSVLLHELAHVGRRDAAIGLMAAVVRALYWPHPLVWGACRALRRESELASDDEVVRASGSPLRYAEHLLRVVESLRRPVPRAAVAMATGPRLRHRIGAILDDSRDRGVPGRGGRLALGAVVLVALLATAVPVSLAAASAQGGEALGWLDTEAVALRAASAPVPELFAGCGAGSTSTSIEAEDDRQRIRVRAGRCEIRIDSAGTIEFTDDERRIERLSAGASLVLEQIRPEVRRRLEVEPAADGSPRISWWIDGRRASFDDGAQAWLATMIPQIYRLTGWQAEARVARLLASGGIDAALAEVPRILSDHVQAIYLAEILEQGEIEGAPLRRWLDLAGREIGSDHELGRVLERIPLHRLGDAGVQSAFVGAASTIGSDHELRAALEYLLRGERLSAELLEPLLRVAADIGSDFELAELMVTISERFPRDLRLPNAFYDALATIASDYEMRRALGRVLERPMASGDIARALALAERIGSDFELTELVLDLAARWPVDEPLPVELDRVVATIGSDYEMRRALTRIIDRPLAAAELVRVLELSKQIGSDHELAALLLAVLQRHGDPVEARPAFEAALDGIGSRAERGRVLDAWRHAGG